MQRDCTLRHALLLCAILEVVAAHIVCMWRVLLTCENLLYGQIIRKVSLMDIWNLLM